MASKKSGGWVFKLGIVGLIAGGIIGFLYRPSAPLIGQLPLFDVLTRGANLKGVNQILIPMAQSSFNHVLAAAVIGAVIGIVVGLLVAKR